MSDSSPEKVVLASANAGKLRELARVLEPLGMELVVQSELGVNAAEETGVSFIENALLKARHAARHTGLAAIADDSGLAVDALDGRPGVYSSRYAGDGASDAANVDRLLADMREVDGAGRSARFHCLVVFVRYDRDPTPLIAEGRWHGSIALQRRGSGGFGYDPVFLDGGSGMAAAEMTAQQKDRVSHRGQALRSLSKMLQA